MNIVQALQILRPKAQWNLRGNDNYLDGYSYECLEWLDSNQTQPTIDEINNCIAQYSYKDLRKDEYPDPSYLFDALVHKENGDSTQYNDYIAKCNNVKEKYPKPS